MSTRSWPLLGVAALALAGSAPAGRGAEPSPDPAAALDQAIDAAESGLREGEPHVAESHYRAALLEGWLLMGALDAAEGRLSEAREACRRASASAVETRRAFQSLALVHLRMGETDQAVGLLTRVVGRNPRDAAARRLLVQALVAAGRPAEAVQELEEARAAAPDDLELAFQLATGYLRLGKVEAAERLFARLVEARPIPQTHVLVGRAYRDAGQYDRARAALLAALAQDPKARRAHYYLGMAAVLEYGVARLEVAIDEFRKELALAPEDPVTSLRLGMALVEAQRPDEALPALERAAGAEPPPSDALLYLGRCRLALDQPAQAETALRRALELARAQHAGESRLLSIHYQLGLALRRRGDADEAATHFAEAERSSARRAEGTRERLTRYLTDTPDPESAAADVAPALEASLLSGLAPPQRLDLRRRVTAALARASMNLGVLQAQAERFARASEHFEEAAAVDPEFPQVQYSLGVARFNGRQFAAATEPLARALGQQPDDAGLRRMLALAWLNTEAYEKAVELLRDDPERSRDPSLQYAYGLALVRSGRAGEAQRIFGQLVVRHGDSAALSVLMGQAHAAQGDFDGAIADLQRALHLEAGVAEANATLGVIYLKQGRLPEAEAALRAELATRPDDTQARHHLATVLDLEGRPEEALPLLRAVLRAKPEFADARYLLGKILLAQGGAAEAAEHLEAAARLAPEEASVRYQLAQAYQKLGRADDAQREFEVFRRLKDERREAAP